MTLATGVNRCLLVGQIGSGPWRNAPADGRSESVAFSLAIPETGKDGQTYRTFIRIEAYGRTVQDALALHASDVALIEGKLSWSKGAGEGKAALCVVALGVMKLSSDQPMTG